MENPPRYADLLDRVKAVFADMIVLVILMFVITNVFASLPNVPVEARVAALIFIFGLYEPLTVSLLGGTIGHLVNGLRVKREDNPTKNVPLHLAIVRYFVKVLLGGISLFTVNGHWKSMAIHDLAVRSIVVRKK